MRNSLVLLFLTVSFLGMGCSQASKKPAKEAGKTKLPKEDLQKKFEKIAELLPENLKLDMPLQGDKSHPNIKEKLVELGADVKNGKIWDRNDKEVIFRITSSGGEDKKRSEEDRKKWQEYIKELREKFTVIVIEKHFK